MKKLGLRYTTWDKTNRLYAYQRFVPERAIWFIQKKKIYVSLGQTEHEARTRYHEVHSRWEAAIQRGLALLAGEPDEDDLNYRIIQFLSASAARDGGVLREIDWELNWLEREAIWKRWQEWNEIHHQKRSIS